MARGGSLLRRTLEQELSFNSEDLHENCGVAAVFIPQGSRHQGKAPQILYKLLLNLQGRGQLSAGMTTYNPQRSNLLQTYKNRGLVSEVFKESDKDEQKILFERLSGNEGIGHTRYATSGSDDRMNAQPLEREHGKKRKWFSICFNGNIANCAALQKAIEEKDYHLKHGNDTEILMHHFALELQRQQDATDTNWADVFSSFSKTFDGSYNVGLLNARGDLVMYRDHMGFRPMCYGKLEDMLLVASESNALLNSRIDDDDIKYLNPGEMIHVHNDKIEVKQVVTPENLARCFFEWVYFSNVISSFDGKSVYSVRQRLGEELAKLEIEPVNGKDYVVVPVPDSSKAVGDAFAFALGLPSREGLVKNRFTERIFIDGTPDKEEKVRDKFTVQREIVEGKKVLLVDDSIVRGPTIKGIVRYLKESGKAREVHVRISCPPIGAPCFYGIDMSTVSELYAPRFNIDPSKQIPKETLDIMAKEFCANSLIYQTMDGLIRAISFPRNELCLACISADYPTECGRRLYQLALENVKKGANGRTHEFKA